MHTQRHIYTYTCDQCGFIEESSHSLAHWLRWSVGPELIKDGTPWLYDFCTEDCLGSWLIEHNFEVEE